MDGQLHMNRPLQLGEMGVEFFLGLQIFTSGSNAACRWYIYGNCLDHAWTIHFAWCSLNDNHIDIPQTMVKYASLLEFLS